MDFGRARQPGRDRILEGDSYSPGGREFDRQLSQSTQEIPEFTDLRQTIRVTVEPELPAGRRQQIVLLEFRRKRVSKDSSEALMRYPELLEDGIGEGGESSIDSSAKAPRRSLNSLISVRRFV